MEQQALSAMVQKFRRRAETLRRLAYSVLLLIAVTLGGGVYLFVIAGELVSRETFDAQATILEHGTRMLEKLSPETVEVANNLARLTQQLAASGGDIRGSLTEVSRAATEIAATARVLRDPAAAGTEEAARAANLLEDLDERRLVDAINEASYLLPALLQDLQATAQSTREAASHLPDLAETVNELASGEAGTGLVISTLATRIGSLLVLIFLVQILINLYRYNIRLSAFFDARADALELFGDRDLEAVHLPDLINSLSPDNLDFGKGPQSPAQQAIDLAREIISRQPRR